MRVEKHEGDFDPAGPVARIRDVVEDTAEVPLDVFALDVQVVRQDELVLAEPALAVCRSAREIEVGEVLALDVALHVHARPPQPNGGGPSSAPVGSFSSRYCSCTAITGVSDSTPGRSGRPFWS